MMRSVDRRRYDVDAAARLRAAGWSLRQIARRLGVSDSTVRADLRTAPAPLRPHPLPCPFTGDWRPEAVRLRAAGHPDHRNSQPMPFHMIASRLAIDERDVRRYFARLRKRDARAASASALRSEGLSARKPDVRPGSDARIARPHEAPGNVIPLRRRIS